MGRKVLELDNLPDTPKSTLTFEVDSSSNVSVNLALRSKLNNILLFESALCQPVSILLGVVEEAASQLKIVKNAGTADREAQRKLCARAKSTVAVGGFPRGHSATPRTKRGRGTRGHRPR